MIKEVKLEIEKQYVYEIIEVLSLGIPDKEKAIHINNLIKAYIKLQKKR